MKKKYNFNGTIKRKPKKYRNLAQKYFNNVFLVIYCIKIFKIIYIHGRLKPSFLKGSVLHTYLQLYLGEKKVQEKWS